MRSLLKVGMSVASEKNELAAWKERALFRRYGRTPPAVGPARRLSYALFAAAGRLFTRAVMDTCRWSVEGDEGLPDGLIRGKHPAVFVLWHNRLPGFFAWAARCHLRNPAFRADSIVSASADGEYLARLIREGGGGEIRGSSSRDAGPALREAVRSARGGASIATVGDGPRGPRYRLKPGPVLIARATGLPIIPCTWACNRTFQLHRSWDQLMAPLPFSRLRLRFGAPLRVPADAEVAEVCRELEERLADLTEWADRQTRIAVQFPRPRPGEVLKRRKQPGLKSRHR
jgi:lysophospholipid acyltransferase (LPLAT)-like uncharacterized protein